MPKYPESEFDQKKYIKDYNKSNYDEIRFFVPKGGKEKVKSMAKSSGYSSMAQYIINAIEKQYGIDLSRK